MGQGTWYDTRLGGPLLWPEQLIPKVPKCPRCHMERFLIVQAFAPRDTHSNRLLLLFSCNNIRCSLQNNTWLAWRAFQKCSTESCGDTDSISVNLGTCQHAGEMHGDVAQASSSINWDLSDSDSDTNTAESDLSKSLHLLSLQVDDARSNSEHKYHRSAKRNENPTPNKREIFSGGDVSGNPSCDYHPGYLGHLDDSNSFPAFYINVEEDRSSENGASAHDDEVVHSLLDKYLADEHEQNKIDSSENWAAETDDDESSALQEYNSYYQVLSKAPRQVLRYNPRMEPIWPTQPVPVPSSRCSCGAELVFEYQVLSPCLHFLNVDAYIQNGQRDAGMNFATAAIYTCAKDCMDAPAVHSTKSWRVFEQTVIICADDW